MKTFPLAASFLAAMALAGSAHAAQLVTNGNFSSLTGGLGQLGYNTDATGWSTTGYNFVMNVADVGAVGQYGNLTLWDQADGGANGWNGLSPTGGNYAALDGDFQTAPLTQTITGLTAGQKYTLTFSYAFGQQQGFDGPTNQSITASFGSTTISTATFAVPNHGFTGWQTFTGTFTADSTSDVLSFLAVGDQPVPPFALLTGVSLTGAVPEPATWGMMIVGLGAMGVVARRRRNRMIAAA